MQKLCRSAAVLLKPIVKAVLFITFGMKRRQTLFSVCSKEGINTSHLLRSFITRQPRYSRWILHCLRYPTILCMCMRSWECYAALEVSLGCCFRRTRGKQDNKGLAFQTQPVETCSHHSHDSTYKILWMDVWNSVCFNIFCLVLFTSILSALW